MPETVQKMGMVLCVNDTINTFNQFCYRLANPRRDIYGEQFFNTHTITKAKRKREVIMPTEFWKLEACLLSV